MLLVRIPLGTAQTQLVSQCAGKRGNCACILRKLRCGGACTFTAHTLVRGSVTSTRAARRRSCMAPPMRRESYTGAGCYHIRSDGQAPI